MLDDRDRQLVDAIDRIGPVTRHALASHPVESRYETVDRLASRLAGLANAGHLTRRTVVDVTGDRLTDDRLTEYDTTVGRMERVSQDTDR